jgi:hypothetical protein
VTRPAATADVTVVLGPCDDDRAEVYVRVAGPVLAPLVGTMTGPRRRRDTTLPATARIVALPATAADAPPVSRAIVTEPAYWSPELPNLYRLEASAGDVRIDALIGLRRFGVRGRSFWLDGRRWVPRGVVAGIDVAQAELVSAGLALMAAVNDAAALGATDREGVAVLAFLGPESLTIERITSLARHPSAMLAVITEDVPPVAAAALAASSRSTRGTMLLGRVVDGLLPPPTEIGPFDFLIVALPAAAVPHDAWRAPPTVPLVAQRRAPVTVSTARAACDALQRDLASWRLAAASNGPPWDWAGYCVG